jgi:hypothetical protein
MHNIGLIRISDKLNKEVDEKINLKNNSYFKNLLIFLIIILSFGINLLTPEKSNIINNFNYFNKESTVVEIDFINLLIPVYSPNQTNFTQRLSFDKIFYLKINNEITIRLDTIFFNENTYYIYTPIIYFSFNLNGKYVLNYSPGHSFHNILSEKIFHLVDKELFKAHEEYIDYIVNIKNLYTKDLININQTIKLVTIN